MPKRKEYSNKENEHELSIFKCTKRSSSFDANNNKLVFSENQEMVTEENNYHENIQEIEVDQKIDTANVEVAEKIENEMTQIEEQSIKSEIKSFKSILKNLLNSNGEFSVSGEATELPAFPIVHVENLGIISLPLIDSQANEVIKACLMQMQTTPLSSDESPMETNVQNAEHPSQIVCIKHPEWNKQLNLLAKRVATSMGCLNPNVNATLHKMILYKNDEEFSLHLDSEKNNNAFATLFVQLPSVYTGGEFTVYNDNQSKEYDFGQSTDKAAFTMYFIAHHVDLKYQSKPLASGFRLSLVYMISAGDATDFCMTNTQARKKMSVVLNSMANLESWPFAVTLDNKYVFSNNITEFSLKDLDADRFNLLKLANNNLPSQNQLCFNIARANLKTSAIDTRPRPRSDLHQSNYEFREESKPILNAKEEDELVGQTEKYIDSWHDYEGQQIENDFKIPLNFIPDIIDLGNKTTQRINSWALEDEFFERRQNQYYAVAEYNKYLLVLWPKRLECKIMSEISIKNLVDILIEEPNKQTKETSLENFLNILSVRSSESTNTGTNTELNKNEGPVCQVIDYAICEKLAHLIICLRKPKLAKLLVDILKSFRLDNFTQTEITYKLFKSGMLDISSMKSILIDLVNHKEHVSYLRFEKQIEMLNQLKDVSLIESMIEKAINAYLALKKIEYLQRAIELIIECDLETKCEIFFDSFKACNIQINCFLVKGLFSLKQNIIAATCLEKSILPILELPDEFIKMTSKTHYSICEMLFSLKKETELNQFTELVLTNFNQNQLHSLLTEFINAQYSSPENLKRSKAVVSMFKIYINYLKKWHTNPEFTWAMPGSIAGHPEVTKFLNSNNNQMVYSGFVNKPHADQFVREHSGTKNEFSTNMMAIKITNIDPYVIITKTNSYFESVVRTQHRNKINEEIKFFESFLSN